MSSELLYMRHKRSCPAIDVHIYITSNLFQLVMVYYFHVKMIGILTVER